MAKPLIGCFLPSCSPVRTRTSPNLHRLDRHLSGAAQVELVSPSAQEQAASGARAEPGRGVDGPELSSPAGTTWNSVER